MEKDGSDEQATETNDVQNDEYFQEDRGSNADLAIC